MSQQTPPLSGRIIRKPEFHELELDVRKMSAEELEREIIDLRLERDEVASKLQIIKVKIGEAKGRAYTQQIYTDQTTFWNMNKAMAEKEIMLRRLNRRLQLAEKACGEMNIRRKQEREQSRERRFIEVARSVLDRDTYLAIWQLAQEEAPPAD
jgi:hypothetical protein